MQSLRVARIAVELLAGAAPPLCWACGAGGRAGEPLCRSCRAELRWLPREPARPAGVTTWAAVAYEGPARALVRGLKFRGAAGLADALAAPIAACAPAELLAGAVLVPVPLAAGRLRRRGFNQAERLARALGRRCGAPVADVLERAGSGEPQSRRSRGDRLLALRGSVRVRAGRSAPPAALLVDDVVTTGATLAACAAALAAAGAPGARAVAFARTPGR